VTLNELRDECHSIARSKGWYDGDDGNRNVGEQLMLVVTEVAEAMEDLRDSRMTASVDETGKPVGFPVEIADVMIRIFDLAGYLEIDLDSAVEAKMKFNRQRSYRHGGKAA
jgi:NTP pyrophosphatase (non-canonical NTP hydrolase)